MYHNAIDNFRIARQRMAEDLAAGGAAYSRAVLSAMGSVPRHLFVSEALRYRAYEDTSLPIGFSQTISKPSTVAKMLQSLGLCGDERVLEIGTGSGYQSALLAELSSHVVSMERIEGLYKKARWILLMEMNYRNITLMHHEDFSQLDDAFDAIIVSAGAVTLPAELFSLLRDGGILVIPVAKGGSHSIMRYVKKGNGRIIEDDLGSTRFVPLVYDQRRSSAQ